MERNRFDIFLLMFLLFLVTACKKDKYVEMDYEEIVIVNYLYPNKFRPHEYEGERLQINLIAQNQHYYKHVYFYASSTACINDNTKWVSALKDYPDTIYIETGVNAVKNYRIEFSKDTLTAFYMPIGGAGGGIDLSSDVGTLFYYCEECPYEEKKEYGILLESEIFDTVFNNIIHVRRCLHYSFFVKYVPFRPDTRWHIYYDVDRCVFVQVEHRTLDTNELIYISRVEGVKKIDSSYFNRHWNNAETEYILMPPISPTREL
jgi:hypothetical protein